MWRLITKHQDISQIIFIGALYLAIVLAQLFGQKGAVKYVPVVLAVGLAFVMLNWQLALKTKLIALLTVVAMAFVYQLLASKSGLTGSTVVFGNIFGLRALGVPVGLLIYEVTAIVSCWHIVLNEKLASVQKIGLAGLLYFMQSLVLQSFATTFGLWQWNGSKAPLASYLVQLLIAVVFFYIFNSFWRVRINSQFIIAIMPLTVVFFWFMQLVS